jgi:hypothetical protein
MNLASLGSDFESKKDQEIRELKDMNEAKRDEIYALKTDLNNKLQRIKELEVKSD